jgi:uncharacterized membrane protein YdbT with pleckstrin-like domain
MAGRKAVIPPTLLWAAVVPEPGEQVFFHGHPSWLSMLDFHVKAFVAAVLAGVIAGVATALASNHAEVGWVIVGVLAVLGLALLVGFVRRRSTTYTITSERLTVQLGLLSRELHETRLDRVQNVASRQSLLERLLGIGTVDFDTAGGAGFDFAFRGVDHPETIVRTVDLALRGQTRPLV